jgi:hypothetical protein
LTQSFFLSFFLHRVLMTSFLAGVWKWSTYFDNDDWWPWCHFIHFSVADRRENGLKGNITHFIGDIYIRPSCQRWHAPCFNKKNKKKERLRETPPFSSSPIHVIYKYNRARFYLFIFIWLAFFFYIYLTWRMSEL